MCIIIIINKGCRDVFTLISIIDLNKKCNNWIIIRYEFALQLTFPKLKELFHVNENLLIRVNIFNHFLQEISLAYAKDFPSVYLMTF